MSSGSGIFKRLYALRIHHILLWLCYFAFWIAVYKDFYPTLTPLVITTSVYFVFNAIPFYATAYYLFPQFLYKRRYAKFFIYLVLLLLVDTSLLSTCLFLMFRKFIPEGGGFMLIFVMAFSSIVMVVGVLSGAKLFIERLKADNNDRRMEQDRLENELQYLKAQVNPHFLFNAINSIYILIRKDPNLAAETLIKLSDLLRFQLYDCSDEKIVIEKELEYLKNFVELEKVRKGHRVKVLFEEEGTLAGFLVAPFLMIPFLENAFKFVSNHPDRPNEIKVNLFREDNVFRATFFNTHDHERQSYEVGGIGLKNVKRRLELIYPGKHNLKIVQKPDTYLVTLSIDLS